MDVFGGLGGEFPLNQVKLHFGISWKVLEAKIGKDVKSTLQ